MIDLQTALSRMHNGQWWGWTNPNGEKVLSNVTIHDDSKTLPTQEEVDAKISELELDKLRLERNTKLAETDWIVIKEREEGGSVSNFADWKTYRQALRDIPAQSGFPTDVTFPTKPGE